MAAKIFGAAALSSALLLAACGGGGGGGSEPTNNPPDTATGSSTAGPLDSVQAQSQSLLNSFAAAAAGTPLASVVKCGGDLVNQDALDFADTILAGIPAGSTTSAPNPTALANSLVLSAADFTGFITALSGTPTTCASNIVSLDQIQSAFSALNTTGFSPAQLSSLTDLQTALEDIVTTLGTGAPTPSAATLSSLATQFSSALSGFSAIAPASFPGLDQLTAIASSFGDVSSLLGTSGNPTAALQSLVNTSLLSSFTQIIPVDSLGGVNGLDPTTVISQLTTQASALSMLFGAGLPAVTPSQLTGLTALFGTFGAAGPLSSLATALSTLGAAAPGTGTSGCVFAGIPIPGASALCAIIPV